MGGGKIELTDPDGIILDSYVQVWNGFDSATDGWLEENPSSTPESGTVSIAMVTS